MASKSQNRLSGKSSKSGSSAKSDSKNRKRVTLEV